MNTRLIPFLLAGQLITAAAVNYSYDAAGRLTRVDYGSSGSISYSYDKAGNLLSRSVLATAAPALTITGSHTGNFTQGQSGAVYALTVTNSGSAATSGIVTVTETIPTGLTLVSMSGAGWTCGASACTRGDALAALSVYPPISTTVNVASNAPSQVINQASVSGGGSAAASATDPTTIAPAGGSHPAFFNGEVSVGGGAYYLKFPGNGSLFGYYNYQFFPYLYHYDLGFEYFLDANDGKGGAYLYDFASNHWLYTSPAYPFPNMVDLTLIDATRTNCANAVSLGGCPGVIIYYFPDTKRLDHYTTAPRYFLNYVTGNIFTM
jgi:uncharacterized repeat protein (TIGR01451 family)